MKYNKRMNDLITESLSVIREMHSYCYKVLDTECGLKYKPTQGYLMQYKQCEERLEQIYKTFNWHQKRLNK